MIAVRVGLLVLGGLCASASSADPYTYYRTSNGIPTVITLEHAETPYEACEASEGLYYDTVTFPTIDAVTFDAANSICYARLSTAAVVALTINSGGGTCSGGVEFNFSQQECVDRVNDKQIYGVLLALFAFSCLTGGLTFGYQLGS